MFDFSVESIVEFIVSGLVFLAFSLFALFILRLLYLWATDEEGFPIGVRYFEATIAEKSPQKEKLDFWTEYRIVDLLVGRIRRLEPADQDHKRWWFVGLRSRNLIRFMFGSSHDSRGVVLLHRNRGCYLRFRPEETGGLPRPISYAIDLTSSSRKKFRELIDRPTSGEVDHAE